MCFSASLGIFGFRITLAMREMAKLENTYKSNIDLALSSVVVVAILTVLCMIVLMSVFYLFSDAEKAYQDFAAIATQEFLIAVVLFGVVDFIVVMLARITSSIAVSHNIFIVWFIAPVCAALMLWMFGYGEISITIVIAFLLIVIPSIMLNFKANKT